LEVCVEGGGAEAAGDALIVGTTRVSVRRLKETSLAVMRALADGAAHSTAEIAQRTRLPVKTVYHAVNRLWYSHRLLRSRRSCGRVELPGCTYRLRPDYRWMIRLDPGAYRIWRGAEYFADTALPEPRLRGVKRSKRTGVILRLLSEKGALSFRQIVDALRLPDRKTSKTLNALCKTHRIIRTRQRPVLYRIRESDEKVVRFQGKEFFAYERRKGKSKNRQILGWVLRNLKDRAMFTVDIRQRLRREGLEVPQSHIMSALKPFDLKTIYVRGYQTANAQAPFQRGYAITALNPTLTQDEAIEDAIRKTDRLLKDQPTKSPVLDAAQKAYAVVTDLSNRKDIASSLYVMSRLRLTQHQLERALGKTLELYPDIARVSIFGDEQGNFGYPHYYNRKAISPEDLQAAVKAKENYWAKVKRSDDRKGHALEGVVWKMLEKLIGARFITQQHRQTGRSTEMHPYRHTIHLIRPVRGRQKNAELDGVWESRDRTKLGDIEGVRNILETKYTLIHRDDLVDFVDKVKWSKEYGADDKDNQRIIKNGIVLWMVGGTIDKGTIEVGDDTLSVAAYARRLGINFIKISDFNKKLNDCGWKKASIKTICKVAKDANEAMQILDEIWRHPQQAKETIAKYAQRNQAILEQERLLDSRIKRRHSKTILDLDDLT